MDSLSHRLQRSVAMRGVFGTALMCGAMLYQKFAPGFRRVEAVRRQTDAAFDEKYGVDTAGIVRPAPDEVIGSNWEHGISYQAVDPGEFVATLERAEIPYPEFTFIDFGSGKGRPLLLASQFPFKRIIGLDYCDSLNQVARQNLSRFPADIRKCQDIEVICADATEYVLPRGPLALFFFNPFGEQVMARVVENTMRTYRDQPTRIVVLYFTPYFAKLWMKTGLFKEIHNSPAILDTAPPRP